MTYLMDYVIYNLGEKKKTYIFYLYYKKIYNLRKK